MANTGFSQATVAYKVRASDSAPLDINGKLISESGRRQAIAILAGTQNPNAALYEVESTFATNAILAGTPTQIKSDECVTGYISLSKQQIVLSVTAPAQQLDVLSSAGWTIYSQPAGIVIISPLEGGRGVTAVTLTRTGVEGQGPVVFRNSATGQLATAYVVSTDIVSWILATGMWNNNGIWMATGIWNY